MDVPAAGTLQARTAMLTVARNLTCFIKSMLWESFFLAVFSPLKSRTSLCLFPLVK